MDVAGNRKRRRFLRLIDWSLVVIAVSPLFVAMILCLPMIGNVAAVTFANALGCKVNASGVHPCELLGYDIGEVVYNYAMGSMLGGIINPLLFAGLVSELPSFIVPLWAIIVALLLVSKFIAKSRLALAKDLSDKLN
jgi:hypothetical protein